MGNAKKGGRPKLSIDESSSARIEIRCQKKEKEKMIELANENDLTVSDYILRSCLNKKIIAKRVELFDELQKLSAELGKSGSNINQLAHHANRVSKIKEVDVSVIETMNLLIESYIKKQEEILISVKGIYREIAKG